MEEIEKSRINEDFLVTLMTEGIGAQITFQTIDIVNPFLEMLKSLKIICYDQKYSIKDLINFLNSSTDLNQLNGDYKYCISLASTTKLLNFDNLKTIQEILHSENFMEITAINSIASFESKVTSGITSNRELETRKKNIDNMRKKHIKELKMVVYKFYELISKAHSINKTYRKCYEDKKILAFSHRIRGWSSPAYHLNENFSTEFKTNFGFGNSSYFYVKIKYKNVDICPISEWINYGAAEFSEIIRYTRSFTIKETEEAYSGRLKYTTVIENDHWADALIFVQQAYNLSIKDEVNFVEIYILKECEEMVKGLEDIMKETMYTSHRDNEIYYTRNKDGHKLFDFGGEKISGALDFISKILEFKGIIAVEGFINRIELLNRLMQPILIKESKVITTKLNILNVEFNTLAPEFNKLSEKYKFYSEEKQHIKDEIAIQKKIKGYEIKPKDVQEVLKMKFPEFDEFNFKYIRLLKEFTELKEEIAILNSISSNIKNYNIKIEDYFKKLEDYELIN